MAVSFRVRMIGVAGAVVLAVLAIVLAVLGSAVREVEVDRLDARLCLEARRLASQPFRNDEFARLEPDVLAKLRLNEPSQLGMQVERGGVVVFGTPELAKALASARYDGSRRGDARRDPAPPPPAPGSPDPQDDRVATNRRGAADCEIASFGRGSETWHVARAEGPEGRGLVAADVAGASAEVLAVANDTLRFVVPLTLVLAALAAWLLSAVAIRPLARLRDAMKSVSEKDLRRRLETRGEDREFRQLIDSYNAMLDRLEASFEQASRFSADAAHELRTPLTILQGRLEQAIRQSEHRAIQADLTEMQEEIGRLASITRKLLLLSQADAGKLALRCSRIDLTDMLDALVADARMLAGTGQVRGVVDRNLAVQADPDLLRQLLNNLVSNAIRYCKPDGWIDVSAHRSGANVEVTFANAVERIDPANRRRLFDRFHRLDPARGRDTEGTGLGLSLAREIARAHGGDLVLDDGRANEFRLRLVLSSA